ncbi:MAG: Ribosomal RNA small subunit methyltransferase I [Parcubacteria group bacterium GW2011_GWA2_47_64]|nr:MAG: Ribosomal RNA small subunit methyltransferase I [Parcubacteria group bacterium GW2011_GWA2_47_64]KKU96009.1 MAG: Ribosomal RNA small subunit methyltransferase I [Parcubacteria group bacterium GW2011_GWC2_48_17]
MATLYIVGTPIGNLEDITLRALRVLKEADLIFAEDTRVTKKLLAHFEIGTQVARTHTRDEKRAAAEIISALESGKNVALVSDAGTPGISDPGAMLVQKVREYFQSDKVQPFSRFKVEPLKIECVPGPSALTAALSISGVPAHDFVFLGFLPHKKGRETLFKEITASKRTVVFYESPHRILKTLESLSKHAPEKQLAICRELTKVHEEVKSGSATELLEFFKNNPEKVRGEFVVIVSA